MLIVLAALIGNHLPAEEIDGGPFNSCVAVLGPSEARNRKDSLAKNGMRISLGIASAAYSACGCRSQGGRYLD